jgi:predicted CXXCH cytochrome family protein
LRKGGLLAAMIALLGAGIGYAGIRNSKHDFSSSGGGGIWASSTVDQVCIFCHTPHRAVANDPPLWNRNNPTQSFTLYGSPTLNATPAQPTASSRACLSCHDGSIAIDAFVVGRLGPTNMMALGDVYYPGSPYGQGGPNIGENYSGNPNVNNLANDHPISFVYDQTLAAADGELRDPLNLPLPLFNTRLECATCHEVHATTTFPKMLRVSNQGSALCLTCHLK